LGLHPVRDEKAEQAQKKVDSYVVYVDSVSAISEAEAKMKTGKH
jgi:hypothetical protein